VKQSTSSTSVAGSEDPAAVHSGSSEVVVPPLLGSVAQEAIDSVRECELVPAVEPREVSEEAHVGVVVAQDPEAGSALQRGSVVVLLVGQLAAPEEPAPASPDPDVADEEDDWFDVPLPTAVVHAPAAPALEGTAHADQAGPEAVSRPRRPAAERRGGRRWSQPLAVTAALAVVVVLLAAILVSGADRRSVSASTTLAPPPGQSRQDPVAPTDRAQSGPDARGKPRLRRRPPAIARGRATDRAGSHSRPDPHRRPSSSSPRPPKAPASAPSLPHRCEFCFELQTP